jgi:hypothetical protein
LKQSCDQLARFYKAWMIMVKRMESEKLWGKAALILPVLTGMMRAIDLLGDDFHSAKQAMKDYIEKYKVDHPETMELGRLAFFFWPRESHARRHVVGCREAASRPVGERAGA